jgi:hypothetical protein
VTAITAFEEMLRGADLRVTRPRLAVLGAVHAHPHADTESLVLVPAGTDHAIVNAGPGDVRILNVHAPGGFDRRIGLRP